MTKYEAKVISAYTGIMLGSFSDLHEYIEELLGRPVFTHELASKELIGKIKDAAKADFINLKVV